MADNSQAWYVIVNPRAGGGRAVRRWQQVCRQLQDEAAGWEVSYTTCEGEASALAAAGWSAGYRRFLTVGGDGTHHEVVNGLIPAAGAQLAELVYALLPVGTGNDWIKTHGIPSSSSEWLRMFRRGHIATQPLGRIRYCRGAEEQTAYFANVAGLAYDGYVVKEAQRHMQRGRSGRLFYLGLIVSCLFRYRLQRARLQVDSEPVEDRFYTINAAIGRFNGGGIQIAPHADPAGEKLAVTFARSVSKLQVLLAIRRFYDGTLGDHPRITTTRADTIRVTEAGDGPLPVEADGEYLGTTPVTIDLLPYRLRFIAP